MCLVRRSFLLGRRRMALCIGGLYSGMEGSTTSLGGLYILLLVVKPFSSYNLPLSPSPSPAPLEIF